MKSLLSPLQQRVLAVLATVSPRWTLTGGGALAGFHLGHRTTRDLDLFWHGLRELGDMPDEVERTLRACSFEVSVLRRSPSFVQLQVEGEGEVVVLDLVAEPVPACELPQEEPVGLQRILVDTRHEILVNKLGTLLHRFEPRDLVDLRELIARGGDLGRAMQDAAKKDGGFSPLTLGFCLDGFDAAVRARALGMSEAEAVALDGFRRELRDRIAALARP